MGDAGVPQYHIKSAWHSKRRHLRIITIGAGATGLLAAYKTQKLLQNVELAIYEKNSDIGGTWHENKYPGCACDVPAHIYTYSFEPNPDWSSYYAGSAEIKQYFVNFAEKYDLNKYICLNSKVLSAVWDEDKGIYRLAVDRNGSVTTDWCHVLINGTGVLSRWKWPSIPGLHDFNGTLVHSANWDESIKPDGKRVAIIGTGSSAIQIVPQIQPKVKQLVSFMRSVTWISPPFLADSLTPGSSSGSSNDYSEGDKQHWRQHPEELLMYRKKLEADFNGMFDMFLRDSPASKQAEESMRTEMHRRIGPGNEELKQKLIPTWPPGCRRLTPGEGYLEALVKNNVTRVHKEIVKVTAEGVVDDSQHLHEVDTIICATGFDVSFRPSFSVIGVDGADMAREFDPHPHVYLGIAVPKFPNYFTVNGVLGSWTVGTALNSIEACLDYIFQCVSRIQSEDIRALEVKLEPIKDLYTHADEWHKGSVWGADCTSWYKNEAAGGKVMAWGGSALHYIKTMELVRWEHYAFRYNAQNSWAFLGNGQVEAEIMRDKDGLSPYIRNADQPWSIA
ncbi:putative sterigmatocystin biosynthesis monooxygenase stcW [Cyphellophora attinorum]|uniref:Putative sterigmatocystin biosynthesis monooxygenase stcW n=1 Tax=Cyphellophora attinorum TaxID=1664694 RepID=A0A0N0NHK3_9EURO|nr:putative sterigmatocystin biosynthesis monooxygenase stcW [Phialophora attinorum]KPI34369.1 putative sterigmatocystin biosynthesis monooxygenase stcW [Phialophora attinorum]